MRQVDCEAITGIDRRSIPAGAIETRWALADGHLLRRLDWPAAEDSQRGALLFMPGRSDFYEKYLEAFGHWHARGWTVASADWRGQSASGRLGADALTGHVDDFAIWVDDLAQLWRGWRETTAGPHVLVAHSMGGHLALRALAERRINPDAAVLSAPMLGLLPGLGMIPPSWLHGFARFMASIGDPRRPAWRGSERPEWLLPDRFARLTHDRARYDDEIWWLEQRPELAMGAPSWGWIEAALRSIRLLEAPGMLEAVACPVLILATRADRLVDFGAIARAAARIPNCRLEIFGKEARHELLREEDRVRDRVLALIDRFVDQFVATRASAGA